jgi:DNA repair protein RecO (recombination protein O)
MYQIVSGIVLNKTNYSEYDKIVNFYTLQLGKIRVLFKGVNKLTAKLISFTELATEAELQLVKLKSVDYMFKCTGGKVVNYNNVLRESIEIYLYTCKILEIVDKLTLELFSDEKKYFLLKRVLEVLPVCDKNNYDILFLAFVYRFIKLCGYAPKLNRCVRCDNKIGEEQYFDLTSGVVCSGCKKDNDIKISLNTTKTIQKFYKLNAEEVCKFRIEKELLEEIKEVTFLYLQNYVYKPLLTYSL